MKKEKLFIYRHNPASTGAKILARALGVKMIKSEGSKFTPSDDKVIINWGCGRDLNVDTRGVTVINQPERVANATHKRKFFELCRENGNVTIPKFTTRFAEAEDLLEGGNTLFARTKLQGSSGEGIVELPANETERVRDFPEGTLFVGYIKKKHEFRIHVGEGRILDRQQKKKRRDVDLEDINWRIRSHANGFVFARQEIQVPKQVNEQALAAMEAIGLDFGAVDVIWNDLHKKAYVLEINTAPGLEGSTVISYRNYFAEKLGLELEEVDAYDIAELARTHGIELRRN